MDDAFVSFAESCINIVLEVWTVVHLNLWMDDSVKLLVLGLIRSLL